MACSSLSRLICAAYASSGTAEKKDWMRDRDMAMEMKNGATSVSYNSVT